jgi:ssDNA-binding Zn-finger/Zn-ribbon topoisomerase 1
MEKNCDCNNCDNDDLEEKNDEFTADVVDCSTYKILSNLEKKDIEKTVVI